ncbi:MAG: ATP-binding protein [Chloroflexi bacterium]|nr:ATP-binding protein [Chloroflexota bacterium]
MLLKHPDQMGNEEFDEWIRRLVDTREPEGVRLDYKEQQKVETQQDRRELAKDITSFANELGGTLVYGVPEERDSPQAAPTPRRPYGIDAVPGIVETIENIFVSVITPLLPEYRIRPVELSEYQGNMCYVIWTPESWAGPHMVFGYNDLRFYRRGQFRSIPMAERDVEDRYRRRLMMRSAAEEFLVSAEASHLLRSYRRTQAKTILMVVPLLLMPNRVLFNEPQIRQ